MSEATSGNDFIGGLLEEGLRVLAAKEAAKKRPVTVTSYFDALAQWGDVRHDIVMFGGKYGATRFGGQFDLRKVMKAYMRSPEARAKINRIAGGG